MNDEYCLGLIKVLIVGFRARVTSLITHKLTGNLNSLTTFN
jgi:hypothetical protein